MSKGYELVIDSQILGDVGVFEREFGLAALCYAMRDLSSRFSCLNVTFHVVCVSYVSSYPGIGIHYIEQQSVSIQHLVQKAAEEFLRGLSVVAFFAEFAPKKEEWSQWYSALIVSGSIESIVWRNSDFIAVKTELE